jgi:DNA-binding response OmpR family regulator
MNSTGTSLAGRSILVVEDELLISLDIADAFKRAGAQVTATSKLSDAARLVEANGLSAAILGHGIGRDNSFALRIRLRERGIPYVIYTGFDKVSEMVPEGEPQVTKPTSPDVLVATVAGILQKRLAADYHGA